MEEMERWADTKCTLWNELDVDRHRAANDVKVLQETFLRVVGDM